SAAISIAPARPSDSGTRAIDHPSESDRRPRRRSESFVDDDFQIQVHAETHNRDITRCRVRSDFRHPRYDRVMSTMTLLQTYPTRVEADLDRIALEAEGIPCVVVGVGITMEGGIAGVRLLVPSDKLEQAKSVLARP